MDGEVFRYYCEHGELPPEKKTTEQKTDEPKAEKSADDNVSAEEISSSELETGAPAQSEGTKKPETPAAPKPDDKPDGGKS